LPLGYADGYPRLLSNRGEVLVSGKRARVAGRVCMDLTMIDVTDIKKIQPGDEVVLLGRQGDAEISPDEIAASANTIPYYLLTSAIDFHAFITITSRNTSSGQDSKSPDQLF